MTIAKRLQIWFKVIKAYIFTLSGVRSLIDDASATVDAIIAGKSLIRFGDGEFGVFRGHDIHYQPWSEHLLTEFQKIKCDYESQGTDCRYLLAVPKKYMQCKGTELSKKRVLVSSWAESRLQFKRTFDRTLNYGDSFLFEKKNSDIYRRIWCQPGDTRTVIFVHNSPKCAESFADTFKRKVEYVQCPWHDAFSDWGNLYDTIINTIRSTGLSTGDVQIVLSAGPAGKVLCYYLSDAGYHCVDTGHCWDDPLES